MRTALGLSLLSGAVALTDGSAHIFGQHPFSLKSCEAVLYDTTTVLSTPEHSNVTHISRTLEEARRAAKSVRNYPWTYWPECFTHKNEDIGEEENTHTKYCIYTDNTFARGRGISILATEEDAQRIKSVLGFRRPELHNGTDLYQNVLWVEKEVPGKGRGLFAKKTINRGDRLFASTPVILAASNGHDLPTQERLALVHRGIASLPPKTQDLFYKLHGHRDDQDPIDDRRETNAFATNILDVSLSGVFPEMSMLNHDCRPNANYFFDEDSLIQYVHATETIHAGQEITITYTDNEAIRDERHETLETNWGFSCDCSSCTAHPTMIEESDNRLRQIESLTYKLDDWDDNGFVTPEAADFLVTLYQQERFTGGLAGVYRIAAEVHASFGLKWSTMKYARLAREHQMYDDGADHDTLDELNVLAQDPRKSDIWRKRSKRSKRKEAKKSEKQKEKGVSTRIRWQ